MTSNGPSSTLGPLEQFRIAPGTDLRAVPNLVYMLQLMGSLEAIRASLRWFEHVSKDNSPIGRRDLFIVAVAGAGWCAETFLQLKDGIKNGVIHRELVEQDQELASLWDRVTSANPDDLIGRVYRLRDKYFAHWDVEVMKKFIDSQATSDEREPFIESDGKGKFLSTRYLWPQAAFFCDLVDHYDPIDIHAKAGSIVRNLGKLWAETAQLLSAILPAMIKEAGLSIEPADAAGEQV